MSEDLKKAALAYHSQPTPGKISVNVSKSCQTQRDLSLAYTPGVAEPVREIAADPQNAYRYTIKGNLVAVITNGTAVLGLGNVGALASKPVMEGKGVLFKRFADIDVFDIEIDESDPDKFIDTVVRIAPTFGGINLEDIKAPECFYIERELIKRLDIPVFHDDQHGTAIIICAGMLNALEISQKKIADAKIVCIGAGAAGIASMKLLIALGANKNNIFMLDRKGVIHTERENLNEYKQAFAVNTKQRTLSDAMQDADVVIGVSGPDIITPAMVKTMAHDPVVFALSNPDPEIRPALALASRSDLIMATGRSDYPNQVNNVLGFPFIFRGALDSRASCINTEMEIAAVHALKELAKEPIPEIVLKAYNRTHLEFGKEYIIPKPLDPRLIDTIPKAIIQAAEKTGVAQSSPDFAQRTPGKRT